MEKILPDRVRKRRKELGLSQAALAALMPVKCTQQNIQQLEDGDTPGIMPRYAVHLPDALKTTWEYLTGKTNNPIGPINRTERSASSNGYAAVQEGTGKEVGPMITEMHYLFGRLEGKLDKRFEEIEA